MTNAVHNRHITRAQLRGYGLSNYLVRRVTARSEEHTSELQSLTNLVCRLLLEKKKKRKKKKEKRKKKYELS